MLHCIILLCLFTSLSLSPTVAITSDTITVTQPLTDNQTIVSAGEVFELGFFTPDNNSKRWYLGIWYKNIPTRTIVWVANRDNPLTNPSGLLTIGNDGNIVIINQTSNIVWSTNMSRTSDAIAQLLDSGNFVLRRENESGSENYLWQSFDHPTDTLLPEMKLGWDSKTGLNRYLNSWKSENDPTSGDYTFKLDVNGFPEIFLANKQVREYRSGPWNGLRFSGAPDMEPTYIFDFTFTMNPDEIYYSFELRNKSILSRLMVNPSGILQRFTWIEATRTWNLIWYAPKDQCDTYLECGVNGVCDTNASPVCQCIHGFYPKNPHAWFLRDGSGGCFRVNGLNCRDDGFLPLKNMKFPETETAFYDKTMSLTDCENLCRRNCSCTAYGRFDITGGGSGCVIWSSDLVDLRQYALSEGSQDLYVRVAAADIEVHAGNKWWVWTIVTVAISLLMVTLGLFYYNRKRKHRIEGEEKRRRYQILKELTASDSFNNPIELENDGSGGHDLKFFGFSSMVAATNNFSIENKLGQGGFGPVYKGRLQEGREIAIKRLSRTSGQGLVEFKNELILISKLQHTNLVRVLGCCIHGEEKMLIYEYMPNKSLDCFLFDPTKRELLDWEKRFNIIQGVTEGMLYLHKYSRMRVIHRDLKAGNVLLDENMNPRIADFGMARIFNKNETVRNTNRPAGTRGYMSPEYAMEGTFSVKSDIFSFGVLLLEIVSGRRCTSICHPNRPLNLVAYAWELWKDGTAIELKDPILGNSCDKDQLLKTIQVGLLCVQENANDRPTMSDVIFMLSNESMPSQAPKQPTFLTGRGVVGADSHESKSKPCSINEMTISIMEAR